MYTHTMNGFDGFSFRLPRLGLFALGLVTLLHFSVALLAADAAKPPAPPATAPVAPPPSPKAIAQAFAAALEKGDAPAAKLLLPNDPAHAKWVDATIALSAALKKLDAAAVTRFGELGKGVSQNQLHLADSFKSLEKAQEKIEDDSATLTMPDQPQPLKLTRVAGKWQLQIGPTTEKDANRQLALYTRLTSAAATTAEQITAGKFPTAEDAGKAFAARVLDARLNVK